MTPQTLKLLLMFFLVAALFNLTNYTSYMFYDSPTHIAISTKVDLQVKQAAKPARKIRKFYTRKIPTRMVDWAASLSCENENSTMKPLKTKSSTTPPDFLLEYDATTETNSFYYYNGIRMGPLMCPKIPPGLGPLSPDDRIDLQAIESLYSTLQPGGIHIESNCTPWQTVAIIVPCSDHNDKQITEFLYSLHPILMKQQLEYQIFLVQQLNKTQPLNRGKLLNVGFIEAQKMKKNGGWRCIVFHHHNLVPSDSRNLYRCSDQPRQLAVSLTSNQSYEFSFGGAIAIKPKQFFKINGFSNLYVGNEAVYDDFATRLINANYTLTYSNDTIAKYTLLSSPETNYTNSYNKSQTIQTPSPLNLLDGLSTLTYGLYNVEPKSLYTLLAVNLDAVASSPETVVSDKLWDKLLNQATTATTQRSPKKVKKI